MKPVTLFVLVAGVFVSSLLPTSASASYVTLIAPTGEAASDQFGGSVANAGDVNHDGFGDIIVGARANGAGGIQAGRAYLFLGRSVPSSNPDVILTGQTQSQFGNSVAGAGDVNGDGYDDIIVGAFLDSAVLGNAGRAYVYWGGATPDSVADLVLDPEGADDLFGFSVASAGDFNGDGYGDVLVGAIRNDAGGADAGRAYLFFGGPSPDSVPDVIMTGAGPGAQFGFAVASAGDVNGDGYGDVIVGAVPSGGGYGRAYVFFGGNPADGDADLILLGETSNDGFGAAVGAAGDVNGDGYADFVVGAPASSANGPGSGRAYVFLGGRHADAFPDRTLSGESTTDSFGTSVSTAGDINRDGKSDIVVGAPYAGPGGGAGVGSVSIFYGGSFGATPNDVISIGSVGDEFGVSVAGGCDLDGDGRPDIVVGAQANDVAGYSSGRAYVLTPVPLAVVAPNGGETWVSGTQESIVWTGGGLVDLYLSLDGGFSWTAMATNVGGGIENTHGLTVPSTPTIFAKVAVAPVGVAPIDATADQSDGVFSIVLPTGVELPSPLAGDLRLSGPQPNPLLGAGGSVFQLTLPAADCIQLALYDVRGCVVASREPESFASGGQRAIRWDPGPLPSGTYYVRATTSSGRSAGAKWVLVR
ncbi:MAG: FG-GAP-like repeat-containing protein [bacterium]